MTFKKGFIQALHIIGILLFIYILSNVNWNKFIGIIKDLNVLYFILIFGVLLLVEGVRAIVIKGLLLMSGTNMKYHDILLICLSSSFWANITPGRVGEFYRSRYFPLDLTKSAAIVVTDRVLYGLCAVMSALFIFILRNYSLVITAMLVTGYLMTFTAFFFLVKYFSLNENIRKFIPFTPIQVRPMIYILTVLSAFVNSLLFIYWSHLVLTGLVGIDTEYGSTIILISMISVTNILPVTISGLGTREAITAHYLNIAESEAVVFGLITLVQSIVIMSMLSLVIWLLSDKYLLKKKEWIITQKDHRKEPLPSETAQEI
ncbi:MAG: lysylphosphatidylglycerol synthase transmembrane domain-containing protein [Candidatus Muiribacteriaceae bacterium]